MKMAAPLSSMKQVYFACHGNTCRSPLAQRIMIDRATAHGLGHLAIESRQAFVRETGTESSGGASDEDTHRLTGFGAGAARYFTPEIGEDKPLSNEANAIIQVKFGDAEFGKTHRSKSFSPSELKDADLVITMNEFLKEGLTVYPEAYTPDKRLKVHTLGEIIGKPGWNVADPIGRGADDLRKRYRETFPLKTRLRTFFAGEISEKVLRCQMDKDVVQEVYAESYEPVFSQLSTMIDALLAQGEIDMPTLEECLERDVAEGRNYASTLYGSGESPERKQFSLKKMFSQQPPPYLDGLGSSSPFADKTITKMEQVKREYAHLAAFGGDVAATHSESKKLLECAERDVRSAVWTAEEKRWNAMRDATEGLADAFMKVAPYVRKSIQDGTLEEAIAARNLSKAMLDILPDICTSEEREAVYSALLNK